MFNWEDPDTPVLRPPFRVYWVFTAPFTVCLVGAVSFWLWREKKRWNTKKAERKRANEKELSDIEARTPTFRSAQSGRGTAEVAASGALVGGKSGTNGSVERAVPNGNKILVNGDIDGT
jgi:hypothetical protein